jgi:hypothetical protein
MKEFISEKFTTTVQNVETLEEVIDSIISLKQDIVKVEMSPYFFKGFQSSIQYFPEAIDLNTKSCNLLILITYWR